MDKGQFLVRGVVWQSVQAHYCSVSFSTHSVFVHSHCPYNIIIILCAAWRTVVYVCIRCVCARVIAEFSGLLQCIYCIICLVIDSTSGITV